MTTTECREVIQEALDMHTVEAEGTIRSFVSFGCAGLLTSDEGIVVRMEDGSEFQVSIVASRSAS